MDIQEYRFMKDEGLFINLIINYLSIIFFCFIYRDNIIGLVNIRDFALLDTESGKFTVRNIMNFYKHRYGTAITPDDSSYDVFNLFKKGKDKFKKRIFIYFFFV